MSGLGGTQTGSAATGGTSGGTFIPVTADPTSITTSATTRTTTPSTAPTTNTGSTGPIKICPPDYRGTVSVTAQGITCQKWTSQKPHYHRYTPKRCPNEGLGDHNYCRNPNGESTGSWCYTTDRYPEWGYCECP